METRWVAPRAGRRAPAGTGSLWVRVRNGPGSHKLPQARSRNPTFPEAAASVAPSPAGVHRTPTEATAAAVSRVSTSFLKRTSIYPQIAHRYFNWTITDRFVFLHKQKGDFRLKALQRMDRSSLSSAAHGCTRCEHPTPRSGVPCRLITD